jgi:hypothetical protein
MRAIYEGPVVIVRMFKPVQYAEHQCASVITYVSLDLRLRLLAA